MIVFTDNHFVGGQYYTPGMLAVFDSDTETDLINDGVAVEHTLTIGTVDHATTADSATTATTATHATTADSASTADTATTALAAGSATTAVTASSATTAGHATTADSATNATTATNAGHATTSDSATTATTATSASALLDASTQIFPTLAKPVEAIAGSAVAASCSSTALDEILATFVIDTGVIGPNSILQIEPLWTYTNSANNKILKVKIGSFTVYNQTRTTSVKEAPLIILANRNSLASQIQPYDNTYLTAGSGAPATYTINFAGPVVVQITGQRANSGDTLTLEYFRCLHFLGD